MEAVSSTGDNAKPLVFIRSCTFGVSAQVFINCRPRWSNGDLPLLLRLQLDFVSRRGLLSLLLRGTVGRVTLLLLRRTGDGVSQTNE